MVNEKLSKGLLRSTSKRAPSRLTYSLVYVSFLWSGSSRSDADTSASLRPGKTSMIKAYQIKNQRAKLLHLSSKGFVPI